MQQLPLPLKKNSIRLGRVELREPASARAGSIIKKKKKEESKGKDGKRKRISWSPESFMFKLGQSWSLFTAS